MSKDNGILVLPEEVLKFVASHLYAPDQLLTLALTCKRLLTVVEGIAQEFIDAEATDEERNNLPRVNLQTTGDEAKDLAGRNWGVITKYQLILKHRDGLQFDQIVGDVRHAEGEKSKIFLAHPSSGHWLSCGLGSSNRIMRSGVHKANFELLGPSNDGLRIGIARPMDYYDESSYDGPYYIDPTNAGIEAKYPRAWHDESKVNSVLWDISSEGAWFRQWQQEDEILDLNVGFDRNDKVGFLLDLDDKTLSFYKNGTRICGVISGLVGEYVWVAKMLVGIIEDDQAPSIRISEWD